LREILANLENVPAKPPRRKARKGRPPRLTSFAVPVILVASQQEKDHEESINPSDRSRRFVYRSVGVQHEHGKYQQL
jgi:hypothetical protein